MTRAAAAGFAVALTGAAAAPSLAATDYTWQNNTGVGGDNWNTAGNWSGGLPTGGTGNRAVFGTAATLVNPNVSQSTTVGGLHFTVSGYTLSSSAGQTLTLNSPGASAVSGNWAINANNTSGTNVITASLNLSATGATFGQSSGGVLELAGQITGGTTNGLLLSAPGTIKFTGINNSYTGGTVIGGGSSGSVIVGKLGALGANGSLGQGAITVGGAVAGTTSNGTLNYQGAGESSDKVTTLGRDAVIDTSGATGGLTLTSNLNSSLATRTFTLTGSTAGNVLAGNILDNTNTKFVKTGTGTWTLTGANTFGGGTQLSGGGTLLVNNTSNSGLGTGGITVSGSKTKLGGIGSFTGTATIQSGSILAPGTGPGAGVGTLSAGGLTFQSGSTLSVDLNNNTDTAADTADMVVSAGAVSLGTGANATTLQLVFADLSAKDYGQFFVLIRNDSGLANTTGNFLGLVPTGGLANYNNGPLIYQVNYAFNATGSDGIANDVAIAFTSVPEPGVLGLIALPLLTLRRRRRPAR